MLYQVRHTTTFEYSQPVATSRQLLRMTPRDFEQQHLQRSSLTVTPTPVTTQQREDYFGNTVSDIDIHEEHTRLTLAASATVEVRARQDMFLDLSPPWEQVAEGMRVPESHAMWEAARFCFASPWVRLDQVRSYARISFRPGRAFLPAVQELTQRIYRDFDYAGGVTNVYTPVSTVLRSRRGVCQDFAHLAIACLRALGLPARYVSGYLMTHPPEGQERMVGADATHAWFSAWCPEFGWMDFDPTNNLRPSDEHITIGWGRDYGDVAPTVGVIRGGGRQTLEVSVDVRPMQKAMENRRRRADSQETGTPTADSAPLPLQEIDSEPPSTESPP